MYRIGLFVAFAISIVVSFAISELLAAIDSSPDGLKIKKDRKIRSPENWPKIGGQHENIFWIVQISDIHISLFVDHARGPDLLTLCESYLTVIDPESVILTGDLTDAKKQSSIDTKQLKDEWVVYQNIIKKCSAMTKGKWVDIRGNHDCFDVNDFSSSNNYYRLFSAIGHAYQKGKNFEHGFIHTVDIPGGSTYSFVGIDTCSRPGPNRPFNFFGYMDEKQTKHIKYLSAVTASSNHTVWFGHYPTSLIVQNPPALREIMSGSIMYLCGHLHTLGNVVSRMYARHKTGQLELELGDWKDNRVFRIIAFDHDLVSFTDVKMGHMPIILITNPKNNQFLSPLVEPVEMMNSSTHVRILVFSRSQIKSVTVHINGRYLGKALPAEKGSPLYVLEWDPKHYAKGTHRMLVTAVTVDKNTSFASQHFSLNGEMSGFGLLPRLILMLNIYTVAKVSFGLMVFTYVATITSLRQCSNIRSYLFRDKNWITTVVNQILVNSWLTSRVTSVYCLLVGSVMYLTFGPWFVGYLLTDQIGAVFAWGIIVNSSFIAGGHTYFYAIFQFLTFTVPSTFIVGHILNQRRKHGSTLSPRQHVILAVLILLLLTFLVFLACGEFVRAYGKMAFFLGPLRTGNIFLLPLAVWFALKADLKKTVVTSTC